MSTFFPVLFVLVTIAEPRPFSFHHENVLGTSLEIQVNARNASAARAAEARVLAEIDRLARIFGNHDPNSEFRRWQAAPLSQPTRVSPELLELLARAEAWTARSHGAFDPRAHVLSTLWTEAARDGRPPSDSDIATALDQFATPAYRLDQANHTATRLSTCPLTLDAIAKGAIVEQACAVGLQAALGVDGLLLNLGGDLRACGELEATLGITPPWSDTETTTPLVSLRVRDRAVATSGRSQRSLQIDGRSLSHIIDPRTGHPAQGARAATVIAPRSADADALATIATLLAPAETLALVARLTGVECLIIAENGAILRSPGWIAFETRNALDPPAPDDPFELLIQFEIDRPNGEKAPYRRPYVAVWIEDERGRTVRTVLLWVSQGGAGPVQWLPDLRRWYRSDEGKTLTAKRNLIYTIARPTRPPGKYSAAWDLKDDAGNQVPPGSYTLRIDSAREHGTYHHISKNIAIGDSPFTEDLQGNDEIRAASIDYRPRPKQPRP